MICKLFSMLMFDIVIIGGDVVYMDSLLVLKCFFLFGCKMLIFIYCKLKFVVFLCVGILVCIIVFFVFVVLDLFKVVEELWWVNS